MKSIDELNLSKKEKNLLHKIKERVKEIVPDGIVILFGSRARMEAVSDSDWDILILTKRVTPKLEHEISVALYELELEEDIIINPLVLPKKEWNNGLYLTHPIHKEVETEGISL